MVFSRIEICYIYSYQDSPYKHIKSFQQQNFYQQIWTTKMNNLNSKIFMTPNMNCIGQKSCLHCMGCNINENEDGYLGSIELFVLYLHKTVIRFMKRSCYCKNVIPKGALVSRDIATEPQLLWQSLCDYLLPVQVSKWNRKLHKILDFSLTMFWKISVLEI